jgi:hypothetical protein
MLGCGAFQRVRGHQNGPSRCAREKKTGKALAAFIARKSEIDTILARLTALSSDHFSREPDTVI